MRKGFIYALICPISNDIKYIGQTIQTLNKRLRDHKYDRRHNPYKINLNKKLERLNLLNELKIECLEECLEDKLNEKEKYWITIHNDKKLVNLTDGGDTTYRMDEDAIKRAVETRKKNFIPGSMNHSEETKEKISESHKDKLLTDSHKASISEGLKNAYNEGRKVTIITDEQKVKISKSLKEYYKNNPKEKIIKEKKERVYSEECRLKMSKMMTGDKNPFYGKKHSEETRNKLSEHASKRIAEKNPFYGKKHSEETKDKIRQTINNKPKKIYYIYDNDKYIIKGTSKELLIFFDTKTACSISRFCDKDKKYKGYYIKSSLNTQDLNQ
jgi:ribonuclease HI